MSKIPIPKIVINTKKDVFMAAEKAFGPDFKIGGTKIFAS